MSLTRTATSGRYKSRKIDLVTEMAKRRRKFGGRHGLTLPTKVEERNTVGAYHTAAMNDKDRPTRACPFPKWRSRYTERGESNIQRRTAGSGWQIGVIDCFMRSLKKPQSPDSKSTDEAFERAERKESAHSEELAAKRHAADELKTSTSRQFNFSVADKGITVTLVELTLPSLPLPREIRSLSAAA